MREVPTLSELLAPSYSLRWVPGSERGGWVHFKLVLERDPPSEKYRAALAAEQNQRRSA